MAIEGHEDKYAISNMGRVKSINRVHVISDGRTVYRREKLLKPFFNSKNGYYYIILGYNGSNKPIHRLVAMAFIPNKNRLEQVNHKNLVKKDNRAKNLEWCTRSENMKHWYFNK